MAKKLFLSIIIVFVSLVFIQILLMRIGRRFWRILLKGAFRVRLRRDDRKALSVMIRKRNNKFGKKSMSFLKMKLIQICGKVWGDFFYCLVCKGMEISVCLWRLLGSFILLEMLLFLLERTQSICLSLKNIKTILFLIKRIINIFWLADSLDHRDVLLLSKFMQPIDCEKIQMLNYLLIFQFRYSNSTKN